MLCLPVALVAELTDSIMPQMNGFEPQAGAYSAQQLQVMVHELATAGTPLRVVSYNMLFNGRDHKLPPEYRWEARLPRLVEIIDNIQPDLIGSQELYSDQIDDLMVQIGDKYDWVGAARRDGAASGEIEAIFYRKDRLNLQHWRLHYLSETPDQVSPEPTGKVNALTLACFIDRTSGNGILAVNTHFDFGSPESRNYEAKKLAQYIASLPDDYPVVVTGDFNTFPQRPELNLPFYDGDWVERTLKNAGLRDAADTARLGKFGPLSTSTFDGPDVPFSGTGTPGVILDHIYVKHLGVLRYGVEPAQVDGYYASDHLPVIADVWFLD